MQSGDTNNATLRLLAALDFADLPTEIVEKRLNKMMEPKDKPTKRRKRPPTKPKAARKKKKKSPKRKAR